MTGFNPSDDKEALSGMLIDTNTAFRAFRTVRTCRVPLDMPQLIAQLLMLFVLQVRGD